MYKICTLIGFRATLHRLPRSLQTQSSKTFLRGGFLSDYFSSDPFRKQPIPQIHIFSKTNNLIIKKCFQAVFLTRDHHVIKYLIWSHRS